MCKYSDFILLFEKTLVEIDKVEPLRGASHCGIEPAQHISCHRLIAKKKLIYKYRLPLTALCLMACHGVSELNLQGVEVVIFANLLQALYLALNIEIVLLNLSKQTITLLTSKLRRLGVQSIE